MYTICELCMDIMYLSGQPNPIDLIMQSPFQKFLKLTRSLLEQVN